MTLLLMISRSVLLVSVVLYLYYFTRRKKQYVVRMWLIIVVGLLAGLVGALIDVNLGNYSWDTVRISVYLYSAAIIYSLWKVSLEIKKRSH